MKFIGKHLQERKPQKSFVRIATPKEVASFSKEQSLSAAKFANRKDLLSQILEDGKTYTVEGVQKEIDKFMKGKVSK